VVDKDRSLEDANSQLLVLVIPPSAPVVSSVFNRLQDELLALSIIHL